MSENQPHPLSRHAEIAERIIGGIVAASSPAVSPDGSSIAFVVGTVDMVTNKGRAQLWLAAADGGTPPRPLTNGEKNDSQATWSPDGHSLAFVSARSEKKGEATLHILPMNGPGELRTVASMKDGIGDVAFSPRRYLDRVYQPDPARAVRSRRRELAGASQDRTILQPAQR